MELLDAILRGDKAAAREGLAAWGALPWERAYENLRLILATVTPPEFGRLFETLADRMPESADAGRAINNLERFQQIADGMLRPTSLAADRPYLLAVLIDLFGFSQFVADVLIRYPHYVSWLGLPGTIDAEATEAEIRASLIESVSPLEDAELRHHAAIRWMRRRLVRIAARAAVGAAPEDSLARELSWIAAAAAQAAVDEARRQLEPKYGKPMEEGDDGKPTRREAQIAVVGMGKLGGEELNFSSDIDLIFIYSAEGQTTGVRDASSDVIQGRVTNHDYFCRLCEAVISYLGGATAEGLLYRVDMRLRPDGIDGPLARSLAAFEIYHETEARPWERMALLKGRAVAGDAGLCREFDRMSRELVFDRVMNFDVVRHVRDLKRMIDADVELGGEAGREIKRGEGGIREIEFLVQALQLIHGPTRPELRGRATLDAIAALAGVGALKTDESAQMREDYLFLRTLEHRLQMMDLRQTHAIPEDAREVESLARRCGLKAKGGRSAGAALLLRWEGIRKRVHRRFMEVFGESDVGAKPSDTTPARRAAGAISGEAADHVAAPLLAAAGVDPAALAPLKRLGGVGASHYISPRARELFAELLPGLLETLASSPRAPTALARLESMLDASGSTASYYEIFNGNPRLLALLLKAFGAANSWAQTLISHPEYHDYVFSPGFLAEPPTPERIARRIARWSAGAEGLAPALARVKRFEYAMAGLAECAGLADFDTATARLSATADAIIDAAARAAPGLGGAPGFAAVALGKLGSRELNYFSDLDLIFCWDDRAAGGLGDARATAVGEWIMERLTGSTPEGAPFDVDTRLRPEGKNAPLAPPISRYFDYYRGRADLWEFQSMMKARPSAGDLGAGAALIDGIADAIRARLAAMDWGAEVAAPMRQMRARIEQAAKVPRWALCDFKKGYGGVIDLEFAAQYFQLRRLREGVSWIGLRPDAVFERAAAAGEIAPEAAASMREDYRFLRRLEARARLLFETEQSHAPAGGEKWDDLARSLADYYPMAPDALRERLQQTLRRNRAAFDRIVG